MENPTRSHVYERHSTCGAPRASLARRLYSRLYSRLDSRTRTRDRAHEREQALDASQADRFVHARRVICGGRDDHDPLRAHLGNRELADGVNERRAHALSLNPGIGRDELITTYAVLDEHAERARHRVADPSAEPRAESRVLHRAITREVPRDEELA